LEYDFVGCKEGKVNKRTRNKKTVFEDKYLGN
jgi:hypothetical protein